jgi:hypothetical protein
MFNPIKQSYDTNLKNIFLWTSFGKEEESLGKHSWIGRYV